MTQKKLGLALGGGAARGWAHLGVISALEESGIQIDTVAGTSIGALVGAIYTSGDINRFSDFLKKVELKQILSYFSFIFPKHGVVDGKTVTSFVREYIDEEEFEKARLPFCAVATDIYSGCEVHIKSGNVVDAVQASSAIPGIFVPVEINGLFLADGGLLNPVPVNAAREMGVDIVVAVDLNEEVLKAGILGEKVKGVVAEYTRESLKDFHPGENRFLLMCKAQLQQFKNILRRKVRRELTFDSKDPNILDVIALSIDIVERKITEENLRRHIPDFLIQPALGKVHPFDFSQYKYAFEVGYKQTKQIIPDIREKLNQ